MPHNTTIQELSPGVLSLLPLFYVGWSDSILSPSEVAMIHRRIEKYNFLTEEDKAYLIKYSNPKNPPSEEVYKYWLQQFKLASVNFTSSETSTLAELGLEMARASNSDENSIWKDQDTVKAINAIQKTMGLESPSSLNLMLKEEHEEHGDNIVGKSEGLQAFLDYYNTDTRQRIRKLLQDPFFEKAHFADKEAHRLQVVKWLKALAAQGVGAYAFPQKYGGGERLGEHITVFEMLAYHDLSLMVKFGVQFGLFGGALYSLGTERHHKKYVEALGKAELLGNFAMTETGHGSNVRGLETSATYDKATDTICINSPTRSSGKEYIGNALHGSMSVVFAQLIVDGTSHGVHAILVPMRDANGELMQGVEVEDCGYKLGLNGVDNGRIWYHNISVPRENLLNKYGDIDDNGVYSSPIENPNKRFFTMLGALVAGRICVGLAAINAAKSALAITVRHSIKRRQFNGKSEDEEVALMDYPTHQKRLIPRIAKTYAYHVALTRLGVEYSQSIGGDMREIETKAAGLKALATWHATTTIQECREACGGKGYLAENQIATLKADSDIFTTFEGDNTVLLQLVAKGLLTDFKQSFHDEGFRAVMKYLYTKFSHAMAEINPYYVRNTNIEHLSDTNFYDHALRFREERLLISLSTRMRDYLGKRIHPFDAFLKCQNHMIVLAKAYVERLVYLEMRAEMAAQSDNAAIESLKQISQIYALSVIDSDKGWFLENDYFAGSKSKAIRRLLDKRCKEIRPDIEALINGFGIPDYLLVAPIAIQ